MNTIGEFLKKYLDFTPPALLRARALVKALNAEFGEDLFSEDRITVKGDIAFIRADGILKSEIALRKQAILTQANEFGGKLSDVR